MKNTKFLLTIICLIGSNNFFGSESPKSKPGDSIDSGASRGDHGIDTSRLSKHEDDHEEEDVGGDDDSHKKPTKSDEVGKESESDEEDAASGREGGLPGKKDPESAPEHPEPESIAETLKKQKDSRDIQQAKESQKKENEIMQILQSPYKVELTVINTCNIVNELEEITNLMGIKPQVLVDFFNLQKIEEQKLDILESITSNKETIKRIILGLNKGIDSENFGEKNANTFKYFLGGFVSEFDNLQNRPSFKEDFLYFITKLNGFKTTIAMAFLSERLDGNIFVEEDLKKEVKDFMSHAQVYHFEKITDILKLEESEQQTKLDEYGKALQAQNDKVLDLLLKYFNYLDDFYPKIKENPQLYIDKYHQEVEIPNLIKKSNWFSRTIFVLLGTGIGAGIYVSKRSKSLDNNKKIQTMAVEYQEV